MPRKSDSELISLITEVRVSTKDPMVAELCQEFYARINAGPKWVKRPKKRDRTEYMRNYMRARRSQKQK